MLVYYATFQTRGLSDVAEFQSKIERDAWVNFQDTASKELGITAENCTWARKAIRCTEKIRRLISSPTVIKKTDIINDSQTWYIRSA